MRTPHHPRRQRSHQHRTVLSAESLEARVLLAADLSHAAGPVGMEVSRDWQTDLMQPHVVQLDETLALARSQSYVSEELLVAVADGEALADAQAALQRSGFGATQRLNPVFSRADGAALAHLQLGSGASVTDAMQALAGLEDVFWSSPNFVYDGPDARDFTPNDPQFGGQWHHGVMENTEAWDVTLGSSSIVIAITDDGVDLDHPDLNGAIWTNAGEVPGNGVDDDGNGYVDDVNGFNFRNNNSNVNALSGDNHGTHVGGIVSAEIDNGVGVSGTAGGTTIMPLKWYDGGSWTSAMVANSFAYAADNGAQIVNSSYNMDVWSSNAVVMSAFQYMYDAGVLHFNSAGNSGALNPSRQVFEQSLLVANTTISDTRSGSSNYGDGIDIAAPGSAILSTVIGGYASFSGTSMAAPNAAAVAALIWSANPTWTREQVVAQLLATADNIDASNPNFIGLLGAGRVNSARALTETLAAPQIASVEGLPLDGATATANSVTDFTLRFDQFLDPDSVLDPSNYDLRQAGADGVYDTADDVIHTLTPETTYMVGTNEFDVSIDAALGNGNYRVQISSLQNPFNTPLDGDGDGTGGDPFERFFSVDFEPSVRTGLEGSGASISAANLGTIVVANGMAQHQILGEPGELISAVIRPSANVTVSAEWAGTGSGSTSAQPGDPVAVPTTVIPASGEVMLEVGANGFTEYEFDILRNINADALVDLESLVAPTGAATGDDARRFSAIGVSDGNGDVDEFSLALTADKAVDVVLTGLDADFTSQTLTLVDDLGNEVAFASGGQTDNYDLGILDFVVPASGDYTLRLDSAVAGTYELLVSDSLVFESQLDPALMLGARALNGGEGAIGYLDESEFSYTRVNRADTFIDISATGTPLGLGDDDSVMVTTTVGNSLLPAGTVTIGNNGGVVAGTGNVPRSNLPLPYFAYDQALLPYWDDLEAITGEVYWQELQVDGTDTLIVQWNELTHFTGGSETMTFQLQLFAEGPVLARFAYEDVSVSSPSGTRGRSATIGVQSPNDALQFSYNQITLNDGDVIDILAKDVDRYAISAVANQTLQLATRTPFDQSAGNLENLADPALQIRDIHGTILAADSNGVDGKNAEIDFTIPATGTYFVEVLTEGASGEYELSSHLSSPAGDFDADGDYDLDDIDLLVAAIAGGTNPSAFDLTGDNEVDVADRDQWLAIAGSENLPSGASYLVGDANLDGVVDGQDFIIWNQNKFTATAAWSLADFNADGISDGVDFVLWNANKFVGSNDAAGSRGSMGFASVASQDDEDREASDKNRMLQRLFR
ncbi:MAG: S8 family serine peptidase [Planctomycetota bacterium]